MRCLSHLLQTCVIECCKKSKKCFAHLQVINRTQKNWTPKNACVYGHLYHNLLFKVIFNDDMMMQRCYNKFWRSTYFNACMSPAK